MLLWSIWNGRNSLVWNRKQMVEDVVVRNADSYLQSWKNAQLRVRMQKFFESGSVMKWRKPSNGFLKCLLDAMLAEALSCREALSWLKGMGIPSMVVEFDSLLLINAIIGHRSNFTYLGDIVDDYKILAKSFENYVFTHVRRSANQAAHMLTRAVGSMPGHQQWVSSPPPF
ncbi:hypothetical protein DITRI_Ditri05aG0083600 [Diplodiscus trichospermus]